MGRIFAIGFTPFAIIAVDNVMIIAMNTILQKYGGAEQGDMLVTCATIAQSFMLVVTMPLGGISGGTQTILGYNYGAGKITRVQQAQKKIFLLCLVYNVFMTGVAWFGGTSQCPPGGISGKVDAGVKTASKSAGSEGESVCKNAWDSRVMVMEKGISHRTEIPATWYR